MAELIKRWAELPPNVKVFFIGVALILVIGVAAIIRESVEESRHEKIHWRRGHG